MDKKFETALGTFVELLTKFLNEERAARYPNFPEKAIETGVDMGRRYARIWRRDGTSRSVYCFVDRTNGDILKPEGWKKPAKHPRGSIFREDPIAGTCHAYSVAYLR
jgi:hypothetical protein